MGQAAWAVRIRAQMDYEFRREGPPAGFPGLPPIPTGRYTDPAFLALEEGASDPYAGVGIIDTFGRKPDLVAGPAANTEAGIALVRELTGLEALDARNPTAAAELENTLRKTLA